MSNAPYFLERFDELATLANLFNKNLSNYRFNVFYKKNDNLLDFRGSIFDHNFAHIVGISPSEKLREALRKQKINVKPSILIYQSFLTGNRDIVNWIEPTHDLFFVDKKIYAAKHLFKFPFDMKINFSDNKFKKINIKSDKFVNKLNLSLGFAKDDETGEYYLETNLNRPTSHKVKKPYPIRSIIRNNQFLKYEITMFNKNRTTIADRKQILEHFIIKENLSGDMLRDVKFLENEIYKDNFKDLWEEIVEQNVNLETSHNRNIDFERVSLDDEITYAKSISNQLNNNKVKSNKDIGNFEPDI